MELIDVMMLCFALAFLRWWWHRWSRIGGGAKNLPPGPPGWPIVGNLFQVILQRRPFIYIVRDLRKQYGPIFTMQMGQRTMIIVTSAELIHEALVNRGSQFANRPKDSPIRLIFSMGKCAVNSAEYGPLWRSLRRNLVTEIISPLRIKQCSWIRKWSIEAHMRRINQEAHEKGFVNVMSNCRLAISRILICLCLGAKITEEEMESIESVLKEVLLVSLPKLPDFLSILTPLFRREVEEARKLRKKQVELLVPLIRKRKAYVESDGKCTDIPEMMSPVGAAYVDSLFGLEVPVRGRLGEEELVTLVSEVISAGLDTSATTVEWVFYQLVMDQEIQERLYTEIVGCVGKGASVVTESDVEKMTYLSAIVKETLRRRPPTHFVLSHAPTEETELGGYTIPADATVEFYTAWLTEDPNMWEDPNEFRPERFLNGDGVDVDLTGTKEVRMIPFGVGRRICPAWTLGTLHINMLLANMVLAFKWLPVPNAPPDPTEAFAFTVVMKNSLKALVIPRGSN